MPARWLVTLTVRVALAAIAFARSSGGAAPGSTERVSLDGAGIEGNAFSGYPVISADGRFVSFSSDASNLVSGDTNPAPDVFVRDRQTGTTERVSVDSAGGGGVGASYTPAVSSDGRFVAFTSAASNLVPADANGTTDIFVRDRQAGTTERASLNSAGSEGNGASDESAVSSDGRFVTFRSLSSNLVAGDTNSVDDVFLHDRQTGTTDRMSVDSAGAQGNATSRVPAVSGDARFLAFPSLPSNLLPAPRRRRCGRCLGPLRQLPGRRHPGPARR